MKELNVCLVASAIGELVLCEQDGVLAFCCSRENFYRELKRLGVKSKYALQKEPKSRYLKALKAKIGRYFRGDITALSGVKLLKRGTKFSVGATISVVVSKRWSGSSGFAVESRWPLSSVE